MFLPPSALRHRRRGGLTLVELIVVLAILVILAGLITGKLDGILSKSHSAQGGSAIGETMRYMDTFRAANGRYPDIYDSMLTATGTPYTNLLPGAKEKYVPTTLTQAELNSLALAGVTRVLRHDETAGVPVNDSAILPAVTLTTSTQVMKFDVTHAEVQGVLLKEWRQPVEEVLGTSGTGTDATRTYLAFGIGPQCTLCNGKNGLMRDAPLHQDTDPGRFYNRFVVIFATSKEPGEKAFFVGAVGPDGDTMGSHVREFLSSEE
jgi:prepilin-type N-terminal cleavage/methylation domain-containing protein